MKIKDRIKQIFKKEEPIKKRAFAAAGTDRLLASWTTSNTSANNEIHAGLANLRARSRQLQRDNDYVRRFFKLVTVNVVGPSGFKLKMAVHDPSRRPDSFTSKKIEVPFEDWSRHVTPDGMSFRDFQRLVMETVARDGEVLVKIIPVAPSINKSGLLIEALECDYLDIEYNDSSRNIRMGVEFDQFMRPVAYWLLSAHPGDDYVGAASNRIRVSAEHIIHLYTKERPGQIRGIPWLHSAMTRINHLGAYEEAEIIAARVGASQMGIYVSKDGDFPDGGDDSSVTMEVEPGIFGKAPEGYDLKMFDPKHPAGNFEPFMKRTLMGIAAGLNVAYNSLANDLESVNYSSIRSGSIDERDYWRTVQNWFEENFLNKVFSAWLFNSIMVGFVSLPAGKFDYYNRPSWFARSWDWVDPLKDSQSAIAEINAGINTRTNVLAMRGYDIKDIAEQLKVEKELLKDVMMTEKPNPKEEDDGKDN